jgi:hypothetical protein
VQENQRDITQEELEKRLDEIFGGEGAEEQSRLSNLESVVLTLDWEISDETVSSFLSEVESLKASLSRDKLQDNFLKILQSLGKYLQRRKGEALPETINLLHTVFADFKQVLETQEISRKQKKDLLLKDIERYNALKSKIAGHKADTNAEAGVASSKTASPVSGEAGTPPVTEEQQNARASASTGTPEEDNAAGSAAARPDGGAPAEKTVLEAVEELKEVIRDEFRQLRKDLGVRE